jgi:hypothetical protein
MHGEGASINDDRDLATRGRENIMAAYFEFEQNSPEGEPKIFVFKLIDEARINEARAILQQSHPTRNHVQGTIITSNVPYNPKWSFHLNPNTIRFFEMQIEVCDANVTYIEEHLDEIGGSTLPRNFWCPWSSRLLAEVTNNIDPITEEPIDSPAGLGSR